MTKMCFYFEVHQPYRVEPNKIFDIGLMEGDFFDSVLNEKTCKNISKKSYLPMNEILLDLIKKYPDDFYCSFSISGVALEQFEEYAPEVIESFRELAKTGNVEFICETYYHSLSFLYSNEEFKEQVELHKKKMYSLFGIVPETFRNTELEYTNDLAKIIENLGFKGIILEDENQKLKNPNFLYKGKNLDTTSLFVNNTKLSNTFKKIISNLAKDEDYILAAQKCMDSFRTLNGDVVNLFMDYEMFGEHYLEETGIFDFIKLFTTELLRNEQFSFTTPSKSLQIYKKQEEIEYLFNSSFIDTKKDLSSWTGNDMQLDSIKKIFELEEKIKKTDDAKLLHTWRKLTTSDHFTYMCTHYLNEGSPQKQFSAYSSPYDGYLYFMNVLKEVEMILDNYTDINLKQKNITF